MNKINITVIVILVLFALGLRADYLWETRDEEKRVIIVHNRVLAKVNGKPITVVDVMRKLDMIFFQRFPQYAKSKSMRHEFYEVGWRRTLRDLIDKEILLLEAKELKFELSNGEVRKEMERLFGPNVVANLHSIGLSYDEALELVRGDMIIQRVMYLKVNTRALKQVTPKEVRLAYEKYIETNRHPSQWVYRIVSVRDSDPDRGRAAVNAVRAQLSSGVPFGEFVRDFSPEGMKSRITFSEEFRHSDDEISDAYREVLTNLQPGDYSDPVEQQSRKEKSTVFRIFYLKDYVKGDVPSLQEIETELRGALMEAAMDQQTDIYLTSIRKKYGVDEAHLQERLSPDFRPFELK